MNSTQKPSPCCTSKLILRRLEMTSREATPLPPQASTGLARARPLSGPGLGVYLAIGTYFGIVATKGEVVSWFRIQEMFRF